jgi:Zinc finger, C3HC4 type (RING finger)
MHLDAAISIATCSYLTFMLACGVFMGATHPQARDFWPILVIFAVPITIVICVGIALVYVGFVFGSLIFRESTIRIMRPFSEVLDMWEGVTELRDKFAVECGTEPLGKSVRCYISDLDGSVTHVSNFRHDRNVPMDERTTCVCIVCCERPPDVLFIPCRHVSYCWDCFKKMHKRRPSAVKCPLCMQTSIRVESIQMTGLYIRLV